MAAGKGSRLSLFRWVCAHNILTYPKNCLVTKSCLTLLWPSGMYPPDSYVQEYWSGLPFSSPNTKKKLLTLNYYKWRLTYNHYFLFKRTIALFSIETCVCSFQWLRMKRHCKANFSKIHQLFALTYFWGFSENLTRSVVLQSNRFQ